MSPPVPNFRSLRAALPLALWACPALAEDASPDDTQVRSWGEGEVASVRIIPGEEHPATVVFENRLTYGNPSEMVFVLSMDGLVVEVLMALGSGSEPDVMTLSLPPGFMAEPQSIEVDEGATGKILVHMAPVS